MANYLQFENAAKKKWWNQKKRVVQPQLSVNSRKMGVAEPDAHPT